MSEHFNHCKQISSQLIRLILQSKNEALLAKYHISEIRSFTVTNRRSKRKSIEVHCCFINALDSQELTNTGWIYCLRKPMCLSCFKYLGPIRRWSHHCRACGLLLCGPCGKKTAKIQGFESLRKLRVCSNCFSRQVNGKVSLRPNNGQGSSLFAFSKRNSISIGKAPYRAVVTKPFPKLGINLWYLREFIKLCGGEEVLQNMTTTEVVDRFIKPMTSKLKCSFCELLQSEGHEAVEKATVYICHAWKDMFLQVVRALFENFVEEDQHVIIWFDLFSNNQHETEDLPFEWWSHTLKSAINEFHHTVLVLAPCANPIPLRRAWCLWELYCTMETGCKFQIAVSNVERERMQELMQTCQINEFSLMLGRVHSESSDAFRIQDKERIHDVIRRTVGFEIVDELVLSKIREWVIAKGQSFLRDPKTHEVARAFIQISLAECYEELNRNLEAFELLQRFITIPSFVDSASDTVRGTMFRLNGILCLKFGDLEQAELSLYDCYSIFLPKYGEQNIRMEVILIYLIQSLYYQNKISQAIACGSRYLQLLGVFPTKQNSTVVVDADDVDANHQEQILNYCFRLFYSAKRLIIPPIILPSHLDAHKRKDLSESVSNSIRARWKCFESGEQSMSLNQDFDEFSSNGGSFIDMMSERGTLKSEFYPVYEQ